MKLKTTGILFAVATLLAFGVWAETATPDAAQQVATAWARANAKFGSLGAVKGVTSEKDVTGTTLWHVVKMEKGAVVVAPDTEIEPVIAVIPNSDGVIAAESPLRALLMRDLPQRLKQAAAAQPAQPQGRRSLAAAEPSKNASKWEKYRSLAAAGGRPRPMELDPDGKPATIVRWLDGWNSLDTKDGVQTLRFWNQGVSPNYFSNVDEETGDPQPIFNRYTPENYYCGCVATAGASVMHYFRVPEGAVYTSACGVSGVTTALTTKGGAYDWSLIDNLNLTYGAPVELSDEAMDLLGRVAYDCGVGCGMEYNVDGRGSSGSFTYNLMQSFRKVFNIKNAQLVTASGGIYGRGEDADIGPENYAKIIYNQIRAGAPVVLGIEGHEVVACGYGFDEDKTDYTYVFLGWGGANDAWYALPVIDTKATADGGWYTSTFIDELVTEISPDENFVAVVGQLTDPDGQPMAGALALADGTPVVADENGYWGVRINPKGACEIVDPTGEGHLVRIGKDAERTSTRGIASEVLAQALPDEMTIAIDPSETGYLRIYKDFAAAQRKAIAEGKLLYLIGGTNEEAMAELKTDMRAAGGFDDFVVCEINPEDGPELITEATQGAAFDPRVFDPAGAWDEENGLWDDPETWDDVARGPVSVELEGPAFVSTMAYNEYTYRFVVVYADGVASLLSSSICTWGLADPAKIVFSYANGVYKTNNNKATGVFTVSVETEPVFGIPLSVSMDVTAANKKVVLPGPAKENGYLLTASSSDLAKKYAKQIATAAFVAPSLSSRGTAVNLSGEPGTMAYARIKPTYVLSLNAGTEKYKFGVTGYEIYRNGVLEESGTRADLMSRVIPGQVAGTELELPIALDTPDIMIKWTWEEEENWVHMIGLHEVGVDRGPQFGVAGDPLVVTATPPGGENFTTGYFVWQGAFPREITSTNQAAIVADKSREVIVDWVRDGVTFTSTKPATDFTMQPGYCVEEVGIAEDGSYILQVVEALVSEDEAKVRVISSSTGETAYYAKLEHAFADIRGPAVVEILDDLPLTSGVRVFENVTLRTAADAAVATGTITREGGLFLVDAAAALEVENVTVVDAHAAEDDETPVMQPLFEVTGGALTLKDGARIADFSSVSNENAAAVYVHQAGSFAMEAGSEIENCANLTVREERRITIVDGVFTNLAFDVFVGRAGGVIVAEGSTADLRGGRIVGCEGGESGGVNVCDRSTLKVSGDFVVTDNQGHETTYEYETAMIEVEKEPEPGEEVGDEPETVEVPYEYVSDTHDEIVDRDIRALDPRACHLAGPLVDEASLGRFTSEQTDTNIVASVAAWSSWNFAVLTNSVSKIFNDDDPTVTGVVVTNASTTALVVWSTAVQADTFTASNGDVYGALTSNEDPEMAVPEPIAFTKIEMNADNTEVTLAFTNAVQWCNYAIFGTDTLENGFSLEGLDPVTNFQWQVTEPEVEITLPTNGNLFWKATAAEGLIP